MTEQDLVQRSCKLETSLQNGNMAEFCESKIGDEDKDKLVWQYIKANFETDYRTSFLTLLDYEPNDVKQKVNLKFFRQIVTVYKIQNKYSEKNLVKLHRVKIIEFLNDQLKQI